METLNELLMDEVKDLYSAEKQLTKALPKLAKAAQNAQIRQAFEKHLRETEEHVRRLERVAEQLGGSPRGKKCMGMEGLVAEGKELITEKPEADVLDAGLIGAAQKVTHYEIAAYGTARAHAEQLGLGQIAGLFQQTLDEELAANDKLTAIAEQQVNRQAEKLGPSANGGKQR